MRTEDITRDPWIHGTAKAVRREDPLGLAFTDWVNAMGDWQWFITLTLDRAVTMGFTQPGVSAARRATTEAVIMTQAKRFLAVFEKHKDGVPHVHALLGGCASVNGAEAERTMRRRHGHSRWKILKEGGGAMAYVGKYLHKELVELYVGQDGPYSKKMLSGTTMGGTRV